MVETKQNDNIEYIIKSNFKVQRKYLRKLIKNHDTDKIIEVFKDLDNFSHDFQKFTYDLIEKLDDMKLWKKFIDQISLENYDQKIMKKIQDVSKNYKKEKSEVKQLYHLYQKRKQDKYEMNHIIPFRKIALRLTQQYRKNIEFHIKNYKEEFVKFFQKHPEPILGFDIEEIRNHMICVMGVKINPDLSTQVTTKVTNDIYSIKRSAIELQNRFEEWIKNQNSKWVITHGFNSKEYKLATQSQSIYVNSLKFLSNVKKNHNNNDENPLSDVGLRHFEQYIGFNRISCGILKHKTRFDLFFDQFTVSLDRHLWNEPQRTCYLCDKIQDVLLYCLEDAFVSLLIVVWFVNRNLIPEKDKKYFEN